MDLTEQPEEQGTGTPGKVNPPTGGILEISAPVPYSEAVHNTGKTADASLARRLKMHMLPRKQIQQSLNPEIPLP